MAQGDVHVRSLPAAPRPRTRSSALSPCPCDSQKNMMQALLGAGAMAEDDLLSKLEECIGLHQDAAKRAKLKFADNKDQDKATLDSVVSVLNTQLDPAQIIKEELAPLLEVQLELEGSAIEYRPGLSDAETTAGVESAHSMVDARCVRQRV